MSLRLEMLQVARLAPKHLGESTELVASFLSSQQNEDGGFRDRDGRSDLYYTAFGIEGFLALQRPVPARTIDYLKSFGAGEALDFVHLCCLARCYSALRPQHGVPPLGGWSSSILQRIEAFSTPDGGFNVVQGARHSTAYGCFLAMGAHQDLNVPIETKAAEDSRTPKASPSLEMEGFRQVLECGTALPLSARQEVPANSNGLINALQTLRTPDGAWANEPGMKTGSTNATAAAVGVLRNLHQPIDMRVGQWLLKQAHSSGGFLAAPGTPLPDLLSTATALHALSGLQVSFESLKEPCLDFIDSLWTNEGGFHGHWADDYVDCEYTYYGLLALGHLSL